jgi:hypothetical protein
MGYKRKTVYKLDFEGDEQFDGLEVRVRRASIAQFLKLQKLGNEVDASDDPEVIGKLIGEFSEFLVSWNLETDDDKPVPATYEGLMDQDLGMVMRIFSEWMSAVAEVPDPLEGSSTSGATSPVPLPPMEAA